MSAILAPASRTCYICQHVADTGDVNVRMFDDDGTFLGYEDARAYVKGLGMAGRPGTLNERLRDHRQHVEKFLADPHPLAPMQRDGVTTLAERPDVGFLSVQNANMAVGHRAATLLDPRLETMDDENLIAVARLGLTAAAKRADMAAKGREIQADALARLASGYTEPT